MFPEIVLLFVWLGAVVVSGLSEFDCSTGAPQAQCYTDNSQCMYDCANMDPLYSSSCIPSCTTNLNLCTTNARIACSGYGGGGAVGAVGGGGGGGEAATPTTFNVVEECQAILQVYNPAFLNVADLQILVDSASRGNCDNKDTLLVEPTFVTLASLSSCGQCVGEDGSEIFAADGSIVGCCNDLEISVEGDGKDVCNAVNLIIQSDCLSNFCVPSQVPGCVNAADTCRNACPFSTLEETYSCVEACNTVYYTCFNTCFASLFNTEEPQSASTGVGKPVFRAIMVPSLLVSAFFLVL